MGAIGDELGELVTVLVRVPPQRQSFAPLFAIAALALGSTQLAAQAAGADSSIGALIVAHGGGPDARVEALARQVQLPGPVAVSFLMGPGAKVHRFQDEVRKLSRLGARRITVVPLLVSSHSGHYDQIRWLTGDLDTLDREMLHHLHMSGIDRPASGPPLHLTKAMDDAPQVAEVLAARALTLAQRPAEQALFIVGHGPNTAEDYAEWMSNLRHLADTVGAHTAFRSVLADLVRDDAPAKVRQEAVMRVRELIRLQHELTGRPVVVPLLVASGKVSPTEAAPRSGGLPIAYTAEGLLPDAGIARWVEARVRGSATVSMR